MREVHQGKDVMQGEVKQKDYDTRLAEILQGNYNLHIRRWCDKNYGTMQDRIAEFNEAERVSKQHHDLTGRYPR